MLCDSSYILGHGRYIICPLYSIYYSGVSVLNGLPYTVGIIGLSSSDCPGAQSPGNSCTE